MVDRLAEQARQARPYGMQRLLSRAVWDQDGVRDDLRTLVCQTLHPPPLLPATAASTQVFPVLVIDAQRLSQTGPSLGWRRTAVLWANVARRELPGGHLSLLRDRFGPCPNLP
jgi:hypothetical protein